MNDTAIRRKIAECDARLSEFETGQFECVDYFPEDYQDDLCIRANLKQKQLAMWIKTYGAAE